MKKRAYDIDREDWRHWSPGLPEKAEHSRSINNISEYTSPSLINKTAYSDESQGRRPGETITFGSEFFSDSIFYATQATLQIEVRCRCREVGLWPPKSSTFEISGKKVLIWCCTIFILLLITVCLSTLQRRNIRVIYRMFRLCVVGRHIIMRNRMKVVQHWRKCSGVGARE